MAHMSSLSRVWGLGLRILHNYWTVPRNPYGGSTCETWSRVWDSNPEALSQRLPAASGGSFGLSLLLAASWE